MLSKKMTVSLMSLITIFALVFAVGGADAAETPFEITITGPTTATYDTLTSEVMVDLMVESDLAIPTLTIEGAGANPPTNNVSVVAVDSLGFIAAPSTAITLADRPIAEYPMRTATKRQLRVVITQEAAPAPNADKGLVAKVIITIPAGLKTVDPTIQETDGTDTKLNESKFVQHTITLSMAPTGAQLTNIPKVVSIQRLRPGSQTVVAAFQEEVVTDYRFDVRFVLSEAHSEYDAGKNPNENADRLIEVENGRVRNLVVGTTFARHGQGDAGAALTPGTPPAADDTLRPHPIEGMYEHAGDGVLAGVPAGVSGSGNVPMPTSDDEMYRQYRVTIYPHQRKGDPSKHFEVKIKVKDFHDGGSPIRNTYISPGFGESANLPNGREILTVKVAYTEVNLRAGYRVTLPKDIRIPGGGYLVIAQNEAGSEVIVPPGSKKDPPKRSERTPVQMIYNVIDNTTPELPNLAEQFRNGVVVDVESARNHPLVITEVMWGEDTSLNPSSNSQYIELYNAGGDYVTADDDLATLYRDESLTLVFYAPHEFDDIPIGGRIRRGLYRRRGWRGPE